jgi:hypothetical protein
MLYFREENRYSVNRGFVGPRAILGLCEEIEITGIPGRVLNIYKIYEAESLPKCWINLLP